MMALENDKELNKLKKEWRAIINSQAWAEPLKKAQESAKAIWKKVSSIGEKSVLDSAIEATQATTRIEGIESSVKYLIYKVEKPHDEYIKKQGKDK